MTDKYFFKLPSAVTVAGVEFNVNTDFRCMARFENAMLRTDRNDRKATARVIADTLHDFYKGNIPAELNAAIEAMWWFYRCGEDVTSRVNKAGNNRKNVRLYDYEIDMGHIISSFRAYNIDLTSCNLHWWVFRSLFADLPSDCEFMKIMCYRGMDLNEIKNRKERKRFARLKEFYALPVQKKAPLTKEERDRLFKERLFGQK